MEQRRSLCCHCGLLMRRPIAGQLVLFAFAILLHHHLSTATAAAAFLVLSRTFPDPNLNRCTDGSLLLLPPPVVASPKPRQNSRLHICGGGKINRWQGGARRNGGEGRSNGKLMFGGSSASHPAARSSASATALPLAPREKPQAERTDDEGDNDSKTNPPRYDGSALALDVFAHPYFYGGNVKEAKRREALRHEKLEGMSVREAFQAAYGTYGLDAFKTLAADMGAYVYCVSDYIKGANVATKQDLATKALEAAFDCTFNVAELPTSVIHESLLPLLRVEANVDSEADDSPDSRTIDMSFLDPLRSVEKEKFLVPDKIYVRDSMRRVFSLLHEDAVQVPRREPDKAYSAALIGSPGVGKSILFFLAALDQARTSNVVYYRRVGAEAASVFVMTPDSDGNSVRVWFARRVKNLSNEGLKDLRNALKSTCTIDSTEYYTFVDGPKQFDLPNLLDGDYDYFCTSGGLRRYKNDEQEKRLWILDGWSEEEAVLWLEYLKQPETIAKESYLLCGGNIRDMIKACVSPAETKLLLDKVVNDVSDDSVDLAVVSTERSNAPDNPDRLRTMFELPEDVGDLWKKQMSAYQIVDSLYMINKLSLRLRVGPFFKAYQLALVTNARSVQGNLFEIVFHLLVKEIKDELIHVEIICWSSGTGAVGLSQLNATQQYWRPSISNFPRVDSAMAHRGILFVFQMTVSDSKEYNASLLEEEFIAVVRRNVEPAPERTVVVFVSPKGTGFKCEALAPTLGIEYLTFEVDMASAEEASRSVRKLFNESIHEWSK